MDTSRNHILVFLLFMSSVAATRSKLHSVDRILGMNKVSSDFSGNNGICKSLVQTQGYACQEHTVTTKDGYILGLQRVAGRQSGQPANKTPVFLQHGLMMDAGTWIMSSPKESLAFVLADNGYDVWLANCRGTASSSQHTRLSTSDPSYWEWSWDELVAYDLRATVQYVYNTTGQKMHYVGHSLGTTMALATLALNQLVNMLRSAVLLSPIAYLNQMTSPMGKTIADTFLSEVMYRLGMHKFPSDDEKMTKLFLTKTLRDHNCCINSSTIYNFIDHGPQKTATKNMIHLSQMIRTGTITKYNYDTETLNMNHYGQPTPPAYDMTRIPKDFPLYLCYGGNDSLSDVKDGQILLDKMKNHDRNKLVVQTVDNYAHFDFVFAMNANENIYNRVMGFFKLH